MFFIFCIEENNFLLNIHGGLKTSKIILLFCLLSVHQPFFVTLVNQSVVHLSEQTSSEHTPSAVGIIPPGRENPQDWMDYAKSRNKVNTLVQKDKWRYEPGTAKEGKLRPILFLSHA